MAAAHSGPSDQCARFGRAAGFVVFSMTVSADSSARVWNASTGEPVTPPLRHLGRPHRAVFLPNSRGIVTEDDFGQTWVWELPVDNTPVPDLVQLAHFLSGDAVSTPTGLGPQPNASVQAIWDHLRSTCAPAFTVTSNQVVAWHNYQAQQSESQNQWSAAAFHWRQLLKLRRGDPGFSEHLKYAEEKMRAPKTSSD